MFDRTTGNAIAFAERTIFPEQKLRHDEERNSAAARRRIGQLRKHQVYDVLSQFMLAAGDEYLSTGNSIRAISSGQRFGSHNSEIRSGVRFGQRHSAAPPTTVELRQIGSLLLLAAMSIDADRSAHAQRAVQIKTGVCRPEHLFKEAPQYFRHSLTFVVWIAGKPQPAAVSDFVVSTLEAFRHAHRTILPATPFLIA